MQDAKTGDTVKVHYTGKLEDGTAFESTVDGDPDELVIGEGQKIPAFERAIVGMSPGDTKVIKVCKDEAYGPYRKDKVLFVDRIQLPLDMNLDVGQELRKRNDDGGNITYQVTEVSEEGVTIDANHPLAGKDLTFHIELVEIL